MLKFVAIGILAAVAVADQSVCFSPTMPGPAGCGICVNPIERATKDGSQCNREGKWFDCSRTIEECCRNLEVANNISAEDCVRDYRTPVTACERIVSKDKQHTNSECKLKCEIQDKSAKAKEFVKANCIDQHYEIVDGRAQPTGGCFNNWVHGYSEPRDLAAFKSINNVRTPAECQSLCQEEKDCVRFTWYAVMNGLDSAMDKRRCDLKNAAQVTGATKTVYTNGKNPADYDPEVCPSSMAHECWSNHYDCESCDDDNKRCIWQSHRHISGWKFCPEESECKYQG